MGRKDAILLAAFIVMAVGTAAGGFYACARPTYRFPDEASLRQMSGAPVEIGQVNQYKYGGGEFQFRINGQEAVYEYVQHGSDGSVGALSVRPMVSRASVVSFRRSPLPEPWSLVERFRAYDMSVDGRRVQTYAQVREALIWERRVYGGLVGVLHGSLGSVLIWAGLKKLRAKVQPGR